MWEVHVRNLGLYVSCIERVVPSVECCDSFDCGVWQYFLQKIIGPDRLSLTHQRRVADDSGLFQISDLII